MSLMCFSVCLVCGKDSSSTPQKVLLLKHLVTSPGTFGDVINLHNTHLAVLEELNLGISDRG